MNRITGIIGVGLNHKVRTEEVVEAKKSEVYSQLN